ncbi:MAG TPA: hypothetical protein VII83_08070 [Gaiellaceae bacterium]
MFKRYGPPALVTLLLVATAVAFVVTERLKLEPPPIKGTHVTKLFSPTCRCSTSKAWVVFSLRRSGRVAVSIVNPDDQEMRVLLTGEDRPAGRLRVVWNGHDDSGRLVPSGNYHVLVHLGERRRILLPNVIRLDTKPPAITKVSVSSHTISPDADHNKDAVHISYRLNERARVLLFVDGKLTEQTRYRAGRSGKFDWKGMSDGHTLTGWHNLTLKAVDLAGNESLIATEPIPVRLRILTLRPARLRVAAGESFRLTISTDRKSVRWRFDGGIGLASSPSLVLNAPSTPGRYHVVVRSGPYRARALVIVH